MKVSILLTVIMSLAASSSALASAPRFNEIDVADLNDWIMFRSMNNIDPNCEWCDADKWGIVDSNGNVLLDGENIWIKPQPYMDYAPYFFHPAGYAIFGRKGQGYGVMNSNLDIIIPAKYPYLQLEGNYALAKSNEDTFGGTIIDLATTQELVTFPETYVIVGIGEGLITIYDRADHSTFVTDLKGSIVIPSSKLKDLTVDTFSNGLAAVVNREWKLGYIDKSGNLVIPMEYVFKDYDQEYNRFQGGMAVVCDDKEMYGAIGTKGETIIPFSFTQPFAFFRGRAKVDVPTGKEDADGMPITETKWIDRSGNFVEGQINSSSQENWQDAYNKKNGKFGFTNDYGDQTLPAIYDYATKFYGGIALVRENGKVNVIDRSGTVLLHDIARKIRNE